MKILEAIEGMHRAAGTSVFCGELCTKLSQAGHDVVLAVGNLNDEDTYPVDVHVRKALISDVVETDEMFDVVHIHAIWAPILHVVAKWAQRKGIPVVWSPHGMITSWAMRSKWWKKWPAWILYQKNDLKSAALIHATAMSEVEDVLRMGLRNKIVVAPLGVNLKMVSKEMRPHKTLLFVSRVQRKKGLIMALKAWAELRCQGWRFRIVGPDQENHTAELKALAHELGVFESIDFVGPKYGDDLKREYASADLFILPTHSENFGSVVIESLAQCVPVICTKGAPWEDLVTCNCGWWIDIGVRPLVDVLSVALKLPQKELLKMGKRGHDLVERKYTWSAVCDKMIAGYEELLKR